jgi:hypothetical protein
MGESKFGYVEFIGDNAVCGVTRRRLELTKFDLWLIGDFTKENVGKWLSRCGDYSIDWNLYVTPITDFHAVCGDIQIPWAI